MLVGGHMLRVLRPQTRRSHTPAWRRHTPLWCVLVAYLQMATLEDDNRALRSRNAMLESAIIHSRGQPANLLPHPHPHPHPHLSASSSRHDLSHSLHHPHPHGDGGGGGGSSSGGNPSHPRQPQPDGRFASTTQVSHTSPPPGRGLPIIGQ